MTRTYNIYGDIISQDSERWSVDDVSPNDFNTFVSTVEDGDDIELHVNSFGGSCTGGIAIANSIKQLISKGHKVTCYVDGCACSIASVIACSCSELKMWKTSMLMIHNCWGVVQGNSEELRKQAEAMDMMNKSIVSFYASKFDLTIEELEQYMAEETWIYGSEVGDYKLNATVIDAEHEFKMAASARKLTYNKIPEYIKAKFMEEKIEDVKEEEVKEETSLDNTEEVKEEVKEEPVEEESNEEESKEDDEVLNKAEVLAKFKEYQDKIDELSKTPTNDEINKRVSGMQAKMQLQINELTKDFNDKLNAKEKELIDARATITNLETERDNAKRELSDMASALEVKKQALESLNSSVLRPNDSAKVYDKESARKELASLPMSERQKFYDEHKEVIG